MDKIIEINNLTLKLNDKKILKNISLDIKAAEVMTVIGPNGCGKSSLA